MKKEKFQRVQAEEAPVPKFVRQDEAADMLGLKPSTLARWRAQRRGPEYKRFGSAVAYSIAALQSWIADQPGHVSA